VEFKGKTALITGASSGIGLGYAHELAKRGANLVLVARSEKVLQQVAAEIMAAHNVQVDIVALDLSDQNSGQKLVEILASKKLNVEVLINNAGFGTNNRLAKEDRQKLQKQIILNVATLVDLTAAFLPEMLKRDQGVILNIGSTASYQPVPGMAVYAATKAFVRSFTEAVWGEVEGTNVKVLTVNPGAGPLAPVSDVIDATFAALDSKVSKPSIVVGSRNALMANLGRFAPKKSVIKVAGKLFLRD
jgi:short-subunit dehydrogenase